MELQQLQSELQTKINGTIIQTDTWYIPVHTLKVSYTPILKTKMDSLMKMIFLSFKESSFKNARAISDILLVEELFIEDLMKKMQKTGLIEKIDDSFQLTSKGEEQLQNGVFEEEQPLKTVELLYSPVHHSTVEGDIEEILEFDEIPEQLYRHYENEEQLTMDDHVLIQQLQKIESVDENEENPENDNPLFIQSIDSYETFQINDVPCIEFLVKEGDNSSLVTKVWNTLRNNWDDTLEQDLKEKSS